MVLKVSPFACGPMCTAKVVNGRNEKGIAAEKIPHAFFQFGSNERYRKEIVVLENKHLLKGRSMKFSHQGVVVSVLCSLSFLLTLSPSFIFASDAEDSWKFHIVSYAWLAGQKGTVATLPGLPPADIDINFADDIADNINGALMLIGEARKGSLGFSMEVSYTDIESDAGIPGQYFDTFTSQTKNWMVSASAFYRLLETDRAFLDGLAGIRYWSVDSELSLKSNLLGRYAIDNREDWVDPIVGLKGKTMIGASKFYLGGFFVIGGFGAGSDFMWDGNLNLGYQWTDAIATTIGYRYLDVDYDNDDFLYDVSQDGIVLGLSWKF